MNNSGLNWGIVGIGWIGSEMAEALQAVNGRVYAAVARNAEKGRAFREKYGVEKIFSSVEELLRDENVDIVYVATPHDSHYAIMKAALLAGKHVFSEKAVTVNSAQLEECVEIAEKKGLVISDGTTLLHMPLYKELREILRSGELGRVKMVQVNFGSLKDNDPGKRFFNKDLAGGALLDLGVYAVSFARFFMQSAPDLVLTAANMYQTGVDETSGIVLRDPEGEMAVIAITMLAKQPKRGVVACERAYIEIDEYPRAARAVIRYTEDGRVRLIEAGETARALQYEALDMQAYVRAAGNKEGAGTEDASGTGAPQDDAGCGENLRIVRDVMQTMTQIRQQWGLKYSCE